MVHSQKRTKQKCLLELSHLLKDMKKKYIIVVVIVTILSLCYWYFLYVFCSIYRNNQISWIQSSLISIFINIIIPFMLCFIITAVRKISSNAKMACSSKRDIAYTR